MLDRFERKVTNLRISVTARCNLNCIYCHHEGNPSPLPLDRELSPSKIERIVRICAELGINSVKLTGGEPLLRKDICDIVSLIAPHVDNISMTTNGVRLASTVRKLKAAGLHRVNISLDTLKPTVFKMLTGRDALPRVLKGIDEAVDSDLTPVKLNTVYLRGVNETEISALMDFAHDRGAILQVIELETSKECLDFDPYMRYHADIGPLESQFLSSAKYVRTGKMQNRKKYYIPVKGDGVVQEIEVVRSMHNSDFCALCTRLRITASGELKPCLLRSDNHIDIAHLLHHGSDEEIRRAISTAVMSREPYWR